MKFDDPAMSRKDRSQLVNGAQVMQLVACGIGDKEIGKRLVLSEGAVKSRLKALFRVIGARNRAHAVSLMLLDGWLTKEDIRATDSTRIRRQMPVPLVNDED